MGGVTWGGFFFFFKQMVRALAVTFYAAGFGLFREIKRAHVALYLYPVEVPIDKKRPRGLDWVHKAVPRLALVPTKAERAEAIGWGRWHVSPELPPKEEGPEDKA